MWPVFSLRHMQMMRFIHLPAGCEEAFERTFEWAIHIRKCMNIIPLHGQNMEYCLKLIDELRADVVRGHLCAFHAVGITDDGTVEVYGGAVKRTQKVAMIGALQYAVTEFCTNFQN